MEPEYIAGFFDGEGSLILRLKKDPRYRNGFQIKPNIDITQKNPEILRKFQRELKMGKLYKNSSDGIWHYCIYKTDDLVKFLNLIGDHVVVKKAKLNKFLCCMKIFQTKRHLSQSGFEKIKSIWFVRESEANTP